MAKEKIEKHPLTLKYKAFVKGDEHEITVPLEIYSSNERKKIVNKILKNKFEI